MSKNKSQALKPVSKLKARSGRIRVAVVGGGFSGTAAVVNLIRLLDQSGKRWQNSQQSLEIFWYDSNNSFGRGLPYANQAAEDAEVFILNQPAYAQSPLADEPDLYTNWLVRRSSRFNRNSFTPRALFGTFLESLYEKYRRLAKRRKLPVSVARIVGEVTDITGGVNGFTITAGAASALAEVDYVILAIGHQRNDRFAALQAVPGYVRNPYDLNEYRRALAAVPDARNVVLIGGGPTTVDAVRALEHVNYKGRYTVIASADGNPWAFDPELYWRLPVSAYKFVHLVPGKLAQDAEYATYRQALAGELRNAHATGFGDGHVYYGANIRELFPDFGKISVGAQRFIKDLTYLKGAVTAPENCALYGRIKQDRRLRRVRGRALPEQTGFDPGSGRFRLAVQRKSGGVNSIHADIAINCSQLPKVIEQPVRNELLSNLLVKGWLKLTEDALIAPADVEVSSKIFVLGPHAQPPNGALRTVWGVESFRDEVCVAAKEVINKLCRE